MNNIAANSQWEQCCFQAMTKILSGSLEQMDDDGSRPTLLTLFHPCYSHLPTAMQTLREQAETGLKCQETKTSPSVGCMSATSQPPENSQDFNPISFTCTRSLDTTPWTEEWMQFADGDHPITPETRSFLAPLSSFNYDSLSVTISKCSHSTTISLIQKWSFLCCLVTSYNMAGQKQVSLPQISHNIGKSQESCHKYPPSVT